MRRDKLKVGMVVALASGGPRMTVSDLSGEKYVSVKWFDGGRLQSELYIDPEMLVKVIDVD
jgi:uncharacterized protein YodC (DUF2158 family)